MKIPYLVPLIVLIATLGGDSVGAEQKIKLGDNAALRYWSAFAQMQDAAITTQQGRELSGILDGTAQYDDLKYKDLIEKNEAALETMGRGTSLANCDWGLDYDLGSETPITYVGKSAALARLNVLYAFHLQSIGDREGELRTLVAGLRFSHDIANGGSLLATLIAKDGFTKHLKAIEFVMQKEGLSSMQRSRLQNALSRFGADPLDWNSAIKLEMEVLSGQSWPSSVSPTRVTQAYLIALDDPSTLTKLLQIVTSLPQPLQRLIPNPTRVLDEKKDLDDRIHHLNSLLR